MTETLLGLKIKSERAMKENNVLSIKTKIKIKADVVSRQVDNEEVILNLLSGTYFGLDEIGTQIWTLIKNKTPLSDIVEKISEEYEVPPKQAEGDLLKLIKSFKKCELIDLT
jgi:hypothetical protein